VLVPANPVGPVVVVGSENITLEGKPVGSVGAIDRVGHLQMIGDLFKALSERRVAWRAAHEGEPFPAVASLVVAPGTSGRAFASAYQTIAFAGFPSIRVAVDGRYVETEGQVPEPPCGGSEPPCRIQWRHVLHVQADEQRWRLRVPDESTPIETSGEGPRSTVESFHAAASGIMPTAGVDTLTIHVAPNVPFARLASFLAEVSDLRLGAALSNPVIVSVREIGGVALIARTDGSNIVRLSPEHIRRVIRSHFAVLRRCYENALARDYGATGRTETRFVIGPKGSVSEAHTTLSGHLPPEMGACMDAAFRSLTFDAPTGGVVTVTYPIVFSPDG
jgi:hypothetical protein